MVGTLQPTVIAPNAIWYIEIQPAERTMTGPSNVQDETDKAFADNISVDASLALDYPDDDTDLASDEHLESDHIFEVSELLDE